MESKIIYGSDTGNTEFVTGLLSVLLDSSNIITVDELDKNDWKSNELYVLGIPTWYDGDFTGKKVAVFGLGDQVGYAEWFCDGVGILAEIIEKNGGKVIGNWSTEGYEFEASKAVMNTNNTFFGLCLDEDNQPELTEKRLAKWVEKLKQEY